MENTKTYKVARNCFSVTVDEPLRSWQRIAWRYDIFATDDPADLHVHITKGRHDCSRYKEVFVEQPKEAGQLALYVYRNTDDEYVFSIEQPDAGCPNAWMTINKSFTDATIWIDDDNAEISDWKHEVSLTSSMMLFYMLATTRRDTLMAHASSVLYQGKAYLFIAKSGTGKSTHTRLWCDNIPGVELLNDDHPIVRADEQGVIAYGSPWSGKTHCYKRLETPVGAIGRINRASANSVDRLGIIEAYASLSTSFSGLTWEPGLADARHATIERVVASVPCYRINCLPDADAARVSSRALAES